MHTPLPIRQSVRNGFRTNTTSHILCPSCLVSLLQRAPDTSRTLSCHEPRPRTKVIHIVCDKQIKNIILLLVIEEFRRRRAAGDCVQRGGYRRDGGSVLEVKISGLHISSYIITLADTSKISVGWDEGTCFLFPESR